MGPQYEPKDERRRGMVLIAVMACLAVVTLLCGVLLKLTLSEQRQARVQERRLQAEWLAESGIERAAAKLRDSPQYTGETWEPAAVELAPGTSGTITIEVELVDGRPDQRLVRVRADLLQDGVRQGRHSKEVQLKL